MVTFEYLGAAPIGEEQLPRNDSACVAAHVAPFACGAYRSTQGTRDAPRSSASSPYTLRFQHINGELTAELGGGCNGMSVVSSRSRTGRAGRGDPGRRDAWRSAPARAAPTTRRSPRSSAAS